MQQYFELNVLAMQTMKEIAILTAKNQNAPSYLRDQYLQAVDDMNFVAIQIDAELSKNEQHT